MKFTYKHKLHMLAVVQAHVVYFYTYALLLYDNFLSVLCSLLAQLTRSKRNERENPKISLVSTCKTVLCGNGMWNAVSIYTLLLQPSPQLLPLIFFVLLSSHNPTAFFLFNHYGWPFNVMAYTHFLSRSLALHFSVNLFRQRTNQQTTKYVWRANIQSIRHA